jgi:hypothetical protein
VKIDLTAFSMSAVFSDLKASRYLEYMHLFFKVFVVATPIGGLGALADMYLIP